MNCHICKDNTEMACSDCMIDFGVSIRVCEKPSCRDEHERKCPAANIASSKALVDALKEIMAYESRYQESFSYATARAALKKTKWL